MALISGASSGIGAAFAAVLPRTTDLVLTASNAERLQGVAARLAAPPRQVDILAADLATPEGRAAVIDKVRTHKIDLFISNAGAGWFGKFIETSLASECAGLAVNVVAMVELLHALVPGMLAQASREHRRAGVIIVSSMGAFAAAPGLASYGAAKAFELDFARSLAVELRGEPIDLLVLCPSYTDTGFFAHAGMPAPRRMMPAEAVAQEALGALGRRTVHLCSLHRWYPQTARQLFTFNPALKPWGWPRQIAAKLRHEPS